MPSKVRRVDAVAWVTEALSHAGTSHLKGLKSAMIGMCVLTPQARRRMSRTYNNDIHKVITLRVCGVNCAPCEIDNEALLSEFDGGFIMRLLWLPFKTNWGDFIQGASRTEFSGQTVHGSHGN